MLAIGLGVLAGILFALLTVLVRRGIMRTPDPIAGSVVVVGLAMIIVIVESLVSGHASDLLEFHPALMYFSIGLIAPGATQVIFMLAVLIVIGGASIAYERNLPVGFRARGMVLAFSCALLFACRDNAMRAVGIQTTMDPRAATAWALIGAFVAVAGFALVTRRAALPGQLRGVFISFLPAGIVFGIAYTTLTIALHVGRVTVFAPLNAMQSLWTVLLAWAILGRSDGIGFRVVAAMVLVVSGGILIGIFR